jgi:hypothetical protein
MMRYLIIMNKNTGVPLFSQSYGFPNDDSCENFNGRMDYIEPDMIGGFLATLMGFGQQFNYGEIREINFQDIYILSKHAEDVVIVAVEDEIAIIQETKAVLDRIAEIFFDLYSHRIAEWDGDLDAFRDFAEHLRVHGCIATIEERCRNCSDCPSNKYCIPKTFGKEAVSSSDARPIGG